MTEKYKLLKDMPGLEAGAIFEHREWDKNRPDMGNRVNGCLTLAWVDGKCQQMWCGESFILPGQLRKNKDWFEEINESEFSKRQILMKVYETLKELGL